MPIDFQNKYISTKFRFPVGLPVSLSVYYASTLEIMRQLYWS